MLHRADLSPILYARVCKDEQKEVPYEDIVKGFKYGNRYIVLTDEDFKNANPKKTSAITLHSFSKLKEIDPKYFEKPYYIEPEKGAEKAYVLFQEALRKTGTVGIATFVIRNRQHLGALTAEGKALVLNQMRYAEEVEPASKLNLPKKEQVSNAELEMATQLIQKLSKPFRGSEFKDTYLAELREVIRRKARGQKPPAKEGPAKPTHAKDLAALLRRSIERRRVNT